MTDEPLTDDNDEHVCCFHWSSAHDECCICDKTRGDDE